MTEEMTVLGAHYLTDVRNRFAGLKGLADAALEQAEADFFTVTGPEDNSLAVLVKHLSGNMISRWGNLVVDGESEARDRDAEFVVQESRVELMASWEKGWQTLFAALNVQAAETLMTTVTIRGEPHTLLEAINRQLSHYAYHVGQMVFLAKHFRGTAWETLSIPRGGSTAFNERMRGERGAEGDGTQNHRAKDDEAA
jgi:ABC-type branched-subunit amino acid transport system ATPase component